MMSSEYEDLCDGEPRGRLQMILQGRWKWILAGVMALAFALPFLIAYVSPSSQVSGIDSAETTAASLLFMPSSSPLKSSGNGRGRSPAVGGSRKPTEYIESGGSATSLQNFTNFDGLLCSKNKPQLKSISLSNFYLDAEQFSLSLKGCLQLENIELDNIWLVGNFSRVILPKLSRFYYKQNGDDKRDSYKSPGTLHQTLFFDKAESETQTAPSWSAEQDLLNLGVDITIFKAGTKLLDIRRNDGEIYLNIKYCENVLVNVKGTYDKLTLINCNVTTDSLPVIPRTLRYLNIRNSVQRTPLLSDLLRKQTKLEELYLWLTFHCDWPGYELFLNINDLPLTIKTLGINNADLIFNPDGKASSIKELTIGDYTTNETIYEGFSKLFPNLERINVVNVSDPSPAAGYAIVSQAIKMKVKEIDVVNLHRNYSTTIENDQEVLDVENVLDKSGLVKEPVSCFRLELDEKSIGYNGKLLNEERHQVRYQGLGFDKMDSFEDYLKWDSLQ